MGETDRAARLEAAGWNVMNLPASAVTLDLVTDVPPRSYVPEAAADPRDGDDEPALQAAAEALYGPARYVFTGKGRAAELALGAALIQRGAVALVHPLFKTTQLSLTRPGALVEPVPRLGGGDALADVDLAALATRLAAGSVRLVYLEPGTNALGGAVLHLDGLRAVRELCTRHGALLVLDCARLGANALRDGASEDDAAAAMQRYTALADAFTVSCAKELRVPYGALVGVPRTDVGAALQRKLFAHAFDEGTLLEPLGARRALHASLVAARGSLAPLRRRQAQLERIAASLRAAGVPLREPIGGHALYVPFAAERVAAPLANRALECQLYLASGIRTLLNPYPALGGHHARLALAVDRYPAEGASAAILDAVGPALAALRAADPPKLADDPSADRIHDLFARYRRC